MKKLLMGLALVLLTTAPVELDGVPTLVKVLVGVAAREGHPKHEGH